MFLQLSKELSINSSPLELLHLQLLQRYKEELKYAGDVCQLQPKGNLYLFIMKGSIAGYAIVQANTSPETVAKDDPDGLDILSDIEHHASYTYVRFIDIRDPFRFSGIGKAFTAWLLKTSKDPLICYTTFESKCFWLDRGFQIVPNTNMWACLETNA